MDINELLKNTESKTLEFKENIESKDKILHTIIAFSNTAGGKLVIGITDKEHFIKGVEMPHLLEEKLANIIADNIFPQIVPNIEVLLWQNKHLIIIDIYPGCLKPYYLKNKQIENSTYIRVGSTNRLADQEIINVLKRSNNIKSFDEEICYEINSEDVYFRVASELFAPYRSLLTCDLFTLGILIKEGGKIYPSKGGVLLLSNERYKYFPDSWLQVGYFKGQNKVYILDHQEIRNSLPVSVVEAMNFVKKHLLAGISITKIAHEEVWSIPKIAIREAIINAIVHADYSITGAPIRISIFEDRLEIENPGLLAIGLTINDIVSGISKIRNRVIARVFQELHLIEQWGSGIQRMITLCQEAGVAPPYFEEISNRFRVTFYYKKIAPVSLDNINSSIIKIIQEHGPISTAKIAKLLNLSARTIRMKLIQMMEKGLIVEISRNKNDPQKKYILGSVGLNFLKN
jgi:ATP-dependent DNA helicase RecG